MNLNIEERCLNRSHLLGYSSIIVTQFITIMITETQEAPPIPGEPNERSLFSRFRDVQHHSIHHLLNVYVVRVFGKLGFILAAIVFLLPPIAMITIGAIYRRDCPKQRYVPVYLIGSGIISILTLAWLIVTQLNDGFVNQLEYYMKIHKVQWFLITCLLIWCTLGGFFVFRIAFPASKECHSLVYNFAFFIVCVQIILFVHLFIYFLCTCCSCAKYCYQRQPKPTNTPV